MSDFASLVGGDPTIAHPISFEWYGPVEGNDALFRNLECFSERYGRLAIFVRRLSWVPLNYPCQIDDGEVFSAEQILQQTSEDLQVLCGYWTDFDNLVKLFKLLDVGTADFEIYDSESWSLVGSLGYFEWYLRRWSVEVLFRNEAPSSIDSKSLIQARNAAEKAKYTGSSFEPSSGSRTFLTDAGLSVASILFLKSNEIFKNGKTLAASFEEPELAKIFDYALRHTHAKAVSEDWFIDGDLGHLSSLSQIDEPMPGVDARAAAPSGPFFFFDENWRLCLSASKRSPELSWQVLLPSDSL